MAEHEKGQRLSDEIKTFIVTQLACYDSPKTVADAVREEFGVTVTRQSVEGYDPTKRAGEQLTEKWRVLFNNTRDEFRKITGVHLDRIPIAQLAWRLRRLQAMAIKAEGMGNIMGAAALLEQAAKDAGGVYTGRAASAGQQGDQGGPVVPQDPGADHLAELGERYGRGLTVIEGGGPKKASAGKAG